MSTFVFINANALILLVGGLVLLLLAQTFLPKTNFNKLRRLPVIDFVSEAVRICTEEGRPFFFDIGSLGYTSSGGSSSALNVQAITPSLIDLYKEICKMSAEVGVRVLSITRSANTGLMLLDYGLAGYTEGGHPELFSSSDMYYYPDNTSEVLGALEISNIYRPAAACVFGGHTQITNAFINTNLKAIGTYLIAGENWDTDNSINAIVADYVLFGEEMQVIGPILSGDPLQTASIIGEDFIKIAMIGVSVILLILYYLKVI